MLEKFILIFKTATRNITLDIHLPLGIHLKSSYMSE